MTSSSDPSDGERERCERIVTTSTKLVTMLVGGPPDELDLVMEMIDALLGDAQDLKTSTIRAREQINSQVSALRRQRFVQLFRQPSEATHDRLGDSITTLESIDHQLLIQQATLGQAISDVSQRFKELAAVRGRPSPSLLENITRALRSIQNCSSQLERLGYDRTAAASPTHSSSPRTVIASPAPPAFIVPNPGSPEVIASPVPPAAIVPNPGSREFIAPPEPIVPTPRPPEVVPPPAAIRAPRDDDQPWGSFRAF